MVENLSGIRGGNNLHMIEFFLVRSILIVASNNQLHWAVL